MARFDVDSAGGQVSDWRTVDVIEISATSRPLLEGTPLRVTGPERVPQGEFHELTVLADRISFGRRGGRSRARPVTSPSKA